jgi:hypothetical protein
MMFKIFEVMSYCVVNGILLSEVVGVKGKCKHTF